MKKNKILSVAMVLSVLYAGFAIYYWLFKLPAEGDALSLMLAKKIVETHYLLFSAGLIFNFLAIMNKEKEIFILVAGAFYLAAGINFQTYLPFVILQAVFCFVSYYLVVKEKR